MGKLFYVTELMLTYGWEIELMLYSAIVTQVLLYGVEVWGGVVSLNAWKEIKKI